MKWPNVKLIFFREVRDQLRDRRTLFTIAVLPLLLYPLLGMTFLQVAQFMKEHPTRVLIVGAEHLPQDPVLLDGNRFAAGLSSEKQSSLLELSVDEELSPHVRAAVAQLAKRHEDAAADPSTTQLRETVQQELQALEYDALVFIPDGFGDQIEHFRASLQEGSGGDERAPGPELQIRIFANTASDKSRIANARVDGVLHQWRESIVQRNLREHSIPPTATKPFALVSADVAADGSRRAAVWSKILPFVVLVWALTGAFYPAIDLCAGEKERGTLETLLSSPALRTEIVWGKLLTIMLFSVVTSLLNMVSMGMTGILIMRQFAHLGVESGLAFGPPPIAAMGWLVLAIIPISALFSALSLAIAAFARSSKEGQYYLMPLLLITLPLMILPMLPAARLDLGTSLIPVTGMMLWLRTLIEGQYAEALRYAGPVIAVTAVCCLLAIRWAVRQFNTESVLFRESERWGFGLWLRHLVRERGATPTFGEALLCGLLLLVIQFFGLSSAGGGVLTWDQLWQATLVTQIAFIATPALLMAIMLTRSPRTTLLLRAPTRVLSIPAAILLAVSLHPCVVVLGKTIEWLYPMSEGMQEAIAPVLQAMQDRPLIHVVLLFALLPAVCEELTFRGFILSGFRRRGSKWAAILLSSFFFGITHGLLQQSLAACVVGVVIGYIAVQSRSLLPCILFHVTHNTLFIFSQRVTPEMVADYPPLTWLFTANSAGVDLRWHVVIVGALLSVLILRWFQRLSCDGVKRERRQQTMNPQAAHAALK